MCMFTKSPQFTLQISYNFVSYTPVKPRGKKQLCSKYNDPDKQTSNYTKLSRKNLSYWLNMLKFLTVFQSREEDNERKQNTRKYKTHSR